VVDKDNFKSLLMLNSPIRPNTRRDISLFTDGDQSWRKKPASIQYESNLPLSLSLWFGIRENQRLSLFMLLFLLSANFYSGVQEFYTHGNH
jgi:hypothetical protein